MKKFLLGSIAFFLFSISVSILQTSCDKDADADPNTTNGVTQMNKIVYMIPNLENNYEIWTANYDGTNQTRVNLSMPSGFGVFPYSNGPRVSPDGQKMFFTGFRKTPHQVYFLVPTLMEAT